MLKMLGGKKDQHPEKGNKSSIFNKKKHTNNFCQMY